MSGRSTITTAQLKAAVLAVLPELVRQWLPAGEQRGEVYFALNPRRDDKSLGSFQINTRTGKWRDHAIGEGGSDPVSLHAYLFTNGDYRAALTVLADDPLAASAMTTGATVPPAKTAKTATENAAKLALIRSTYAKATGLCGTPAAAYLKSRWLVPTAAWEGLRASVMHYPGVGKCPVLLGPVEAPDGSLVGVHRTYLQPNGAKLAVPNPRRMFGQIQGCAIRLGQITNALIICEGLEDGLTLYQELGGAVAVWVACGASNLSMTKIPDTVKLLTVAADNDTPGEQSARRAAFAFSVGGREVRIMRPESGFKDYNDQLRGVRT